MKEAAPIVAGAALGAWVLPKPRTVGAVVGAGLGWWASRRIGARPALSAIAGEASRRLNGTPFGAIDPALLASLISSGVQITGDVTAVAAQAAARRAAEREARAAAADARRQAREDAKLVAAQARMAAAEAARLRAQQSTNPLAQPGVVLPLVAGVGLLGILLLRRK